MLDSGTSPCKQHAQQKSWRTLSVKVLLLFLVSSNMADNVGKALVSIRLSASEIQYSGLKGCSGDAAKDASSNGSLLMRYERSRCADFWPSLRKTALARTSNDARMRSIARLWPSFYNRVSFDIWGIINVYQTYLISVVQIVDQRHVIDQWATNKLSNVSMLEYLRISRAKRQTLTAALM